MDETLWSVSFGHQVLFSAKSKELNFFPHTHCVSPHSPITVPFLYDLRTSGLIYDVCLSYLQMKYSE